MRVAKVTEHGSRALSGPPAPNRNGERDFTEAQHCCRMPRPRIPRRSEASLQSWKEKEPQQSRRFVVGAAIARASVVAPTTRRQCAGSRSVPTRPLMPGRSWPIFVAQRDDPHRAECRQPSGDGRHDTVDRRSFLSPQARQFVIRLLSNEPSQFPGMPLHNLRSPTALLFCGDQQRNQLRQFCSGFPAE